MKRRLKLVRKRKPKDDLSFMPPYLEQARYIEIANQFLEKNGASRPGQENEAATGEETAPANEKIS